MVRPSAVGIVLNGGFHQRLLPKNLADRRFGKPWHGGSAATLCAFNTASPRINETPRRASGGSASTSGSRNYRVWALYQSSTSCRTLSFARP